MLQSLKVAPGKVAGVQTKQTHRRRRLNAKLIELPSASIGRNLAYPVITHTHNM